MDFVEHGRSYSWTNPACDKDLKLLSCSATTNFFLYYVNELMEEIDLLETNQRSEMARLNAEHQANLLAARADCERSLSKEKRHRDELHESLLAVKADFQSQKIELADEHVKAIERKTRALGRDLTLLNEQSERIIRATSEMERAAAELERKIEDDAEREIAELSFAAQKELQLLKDANALLTNEKNILQQRHVSMLGDLKELQQQVRDPWRLFRCNLSIGHRSTAHQLHLHS